MTLVADIPCPNCGRVDSTQKVGLGQYRCTACDSRFTQHDIEVP